jgi:phosphatidylglycerophosphatase C
MTAPDPLVVPRPGVAAFDFDGTLAAGDSLSGFLSRAVGRPVLASTLALQGPAMAWAYAVRGGRDAAKAVLLARLLRGRTHAELQTLGERYGNDLVRRLRPWMLARVDWHREQGHRLVIVSASLDVYLEPVGRSLGFDAVLATTLEIDPDGRLTGRLGGLNCRGREKAARLRAWLGSAPAEIWAYGDSRGDRELLAMADHPVLIGRRPRT